MAESNGQVEAANVGAHAREVPEGFSVLTEGKASILQHGSDVFYNPVQVVNRDISVAVLRYYVEQREKEAASGVFKNRKERLAAAAAAAAVAATAAAAAVAPPRQRCSCPPELGPARARCSSSRSEPSS